MFSYFNDSLLVRKKRKMSKSQGMEIFLSYFWAKKILFSSTSCKPEVQARLEHHTPNLSVLEKIARAAWEGRGRGVAWWGGGVARGGATAVAGPGAAVEPRDEAVVLFRACVVAWTRTICFLPGAREQT